MLHMVLVRMMNHRMDLQSITIERLPKVRRRYWSRPIKEARSQSLETSPSANLSEMVNGRVRETQSHNYLCIKENERCISVFYLLKISLKADLTVWIKSLLQKRVGRPNLRLGPNPQEKGEKKRKIKLGPIHKA
jgi:hypothetical protein